MINIIWINIRYLWRIVIKKKNLCTPFNLWTYIAFWIFWMMSSNAVNYSFCMCFGTAVIPKSNNTWILANYDYTGFYRVNYETSMWERLAAQLNQNHTVRQTTITWWIINIKKNSEISKKKKTIHKSSVRILFFLLRKLCIACTSQWLFNYWHGGILLRVNNLNTANKTLNKSINQSILL